MKLPYHISLVLTVVTVVGKSGTIQEQAHYSKRVQAFSGIGIVIMWNSIAASKSVQANEN